MNYRIAAAFAAFVVAVASSIAPAALVEYQFEGIGTGSLDTTSFDNAPFFLQVFVDTDDIFAPSGTVIRVEAILSTISIDGIGSLDFTVSTSIARNNTFDSIVFADHLNDSALLIVENPVLDSYDLSAPFGPVFDPFATVADQFTDIPTTGGDLSFASIVDVTFNAIPSPGTMLMLCGAGMIGLGRRR